MNFWSSSSKGDITGNPCVYAKYELTISCLLQYISLWPRLINIPGPTSFQWWRWTKSNVDFAQMLHVISNWLIALNSATNFFIYCLAGAKFRQVVSIILETPIVCHQIQWIAKCVTNNPADPIFDCRVCPWCLAVGHQPRLVLRAPVTLPLISNPTQPDFDQVNWWIVSVKQMIRATLCNWPQLKPDQPSKINQDNTLFVNRCLDD